MSADTTEGQQRRALRNFEMCALYSGGETMASIGSRYGVTRERVRLILAERGISGKSGGRGGLDPLAVMRLVGECRSPKEIAARLQCSYAVVVRLLHAISPTAMDEMAAYRHEATRQTQIRQMQSLARRLGHTPSKCDLDRFYRGSAQFQNVWGSLAKAQSAAGLPPTKHGGRSARFAVWPMRQQAVLT